MADGALQPEILWGTSLNAKYPAKNILVDEAIFNNKTHANYWLALKEKTVGQGFVMKVGNSKRKIVGISIRNSYHTSKLPWATKEFELEGSLLKEPETEGQRSQDANLLWSPDVLKAGNWSVLLTETLEGINMNPSLENFFFEATTELRYLWFHLRSYYGSQGGGLNYLGPILQSGESPSTTKSPFICSLQTCAHGQTGQRVTGSVTRRIQATRQDISSTRKTTFCKMLLNFAMEMRCLVAMKTAQVCFQILRFPKF